LVQLNPDIYSIEVNDEIITPIIKKQLNIVGIIEKRETSICSICSEIQAEIETPCKHSFCKKCITIWIEMGKMICPYCRQSMGNEFNKIQFLS
jgi:hypothetical protein